MIDNLHQVVSPYFTAGFVLDSDDRVAFAAPIIKYMTGWDIERVEKYCDKKGWKLV